MGRGGADKLRAMPPPAAVSPAAWAALLRASDRFLSEGHAAKAAALGWTALDVWGCHARQPVERLDLAGAAWPISDSEIGHRAAHHSPTQCRLQLATQHLPTPLGGLRADLSHLGAQAMIDHLEHPDKFGTWREDLDEPSGAAAGAHSAPSL
jgi:hypothetical protein